MKMPVIASAVACLSDDPNDFAIASKIVGREGRLRSSKPKDGEAAYVWRMVAFYISPNRAHHCMPCTADFGIELRTLEGRWDVVGVRERCKELDVIVDKIVNMVPKNEWYGVSRWARAFGV